LSYSRVLVNSSQLTVDSSLLDLWTACLSEGGQLHLICEVL